MRQRILFVMQYDMINPVNEYYQNSGNTVFSSAGVSFFWKQNVRYVLMDDVKRKLAADPDWAKRNFDVAVLMEACLFWVGYKENIGVLGRMIRQLGIPMFILGVGVESPGDYSEGFLSKIGDDMKFFCDCVISGGGDMALRGEFTRHCLEKLGFGGFFVSGCPSLYVAGGSLDISAEKVSRRDFRPMFCGYSVGDVPKAVYRKYSGSAFFAQDRYLKMMYHPERRLPMQADEAWLFDWLYAQNRVLGDMNYWLWVRQVRRGGFNFSYGSRIHGNIVALQQRIPAYVEIISARTREICEFYKMPNSVSMPFPRRRKRIYDLYLACDYTEFNRNYAERYRRFVDFLDMKGISHNVGESDAFFNHLDSLNYYDWLADEGIKRYKKGIVPKSAFGEIIRRLFRGRRLDVVHGD